MGAMVCEPAQPAVKSRSCSTAWRTLCTGRIIFQPWWGAASPGAPLATGTAYFLLLLRKQPYEALLDEESLTRDYRIVKDGAIGDGRDAGRCRGDGRPGNGIAVGLGLVSFAAAGQEAQVAGAGEPAPERVGGGARGGMRPAIEDLLPR